MSFICNINYPHYSGNCLRDTQLSFNASLIVTLIETEWVVFLG